MVEIVYGYKLNTEDARVVYDYLVSLNKPKYLGRLRFMGNGEAIFGFPIKTVPIFSATNISEIDTKTPEASNMTWDWEINTKCCQLAPSAEKGTFICYN